MRVKKSKKGVLIILALVILLLVSIFLGFRFTGKVITGSELLTNYGFEQDFSKWGHHSYNYQAANYSNGVEAIVSGAECWSGKCLKMQRNNADWQGAYQAGISLEADKVYNLSVKFKTTVARYGYINLHDPYWKDSSCKQVGKGFASYVLGNGGWKDLSVTAAIPKKDDCGNQVSEHKWSVYLYNFWGDNNPIYYDSVSLVKLDIDFSLKAYYSFDDKNNLIDSIGNSGKARVVGQVASVPGVKNFALSFEDLGYIRIPDSNSIDLSTEGTSISFWLLDKYRDSASYFISKGFPISGSGSYTMLLNSDNNLYAYFEDDRSLYAYDVYAGFKFPRCGNKWNHIVISEKPEAGGTRIKIYQDGIKRVDKLSTIPIDLRNQNAELLIGNLASFLGAESFKGSIDELKFWKGELSEEKIRQEYNSFKQGLAPTFYYVSPSGNDLNSGKIDSPWKSAGKGFECANPGDTVYFREGTYRINRLKETTYFPRGASADKRITYKGYPGETAKITALELKNDSNLWTNVRGQIYSTPIDINSLSYTYGLVVQDGTPLTLVKDFSVDSGLNDVTGPGKWARNISAGKVYVWARGNKNPGNYLTEWAIAGQRTIELPAEEKSAGLGSGDQANYLTFESLVIEGAGENVFTIDTDGIWIRNSTVRNAAYHAIKVESCSPQYPGYPEITTCSFQSKYGLVENNDIYNFGGGGIAQTGGDYWISRGNKIHDSFEAIKGGESAPIYYKNGAENGIIEKNMVYNIKNGNMIIALGGTSGDSTPGHAEGIPNEAINLVAKNNIIYNSTSRIGVLISACINCGFYNNVITKSSFSQFLFYILNSRYGDYAGTHSENVSIKNNIIYGNNLAAYNAGKWAYLVQNESEKGLIIDYNLIDSSLRYFIRGKDMTLRFAKASGYELHSIASAPKFVGRSDFRLLLGSPGIDQGTTIPADDDFNGNQRPIDNFDIGAFEYGA